MSMNPLIAYALLGMAAMLEASGDALVRTGLHTPGIPPRIGLILLGGVVLLAYGVTVNAPPWSFGRLLGVYVTLFFLAAQTIDAVAFGARPSPPIIVGGTLIVAGGLVITLWPA